MNRHRPSVAFTELTGGGGGGGEGLFLNGLWLTKSVFFTSKIVKCVQVSYNTSKCAVCVLQHLPSGLGTVKTQKAHFDVLRKEVTRQ